MHLIATSSKAAAPTTGSAVLVVAPALVSWVEEIDLSDAVPGWRVAVADFFD
jgi:hypothetical protein